MQSSIHSYFPLLLINFVNHLSSFLKANRSYTLSPKNTASRPKSPNVKKLKKGNSGKGGSNINIAFTLEISKIANSVFTSKPQKAKIKV